MRYYTDLYSEMTMVINYNWLFQWDYTYHSYGPKYQLSVLSHPKIGMFIVPLKYPVITNSHGHN